MGRYLQEKITKDLLKKRYKYGIEIVVSLIPAVLLILDFKRLKNLFSLLIRSLLCSESTSKMFYVCFFRFISSLLC